MQVVCVFIVGPEPCGLWPGFAVATVRAARDDPSALRAPPHKWGEGSGLRCFSLGLRCGEGLGGAGRPLRPAGTSPQVGRSPRVFCFGSGSRASLRLAEVVTRVG